jgi:hypothetical protein
MDGLAIPPIDGTIGLVEQLLELNQFGPHLGAIVIQIGHVDSSTMPQSRNVSGRTFGRSAKHDQA